MLGLNNSWLDYLLYVCVSLQQLEVNCIVQAACGEEKIVAAKVA